MKAYRTWLVIGCLTAAIGFNHSGSAYAQSGSAATATAPDAYIQQIAHQVAQGDVAAFWNMLPAKYQADVTSVKNEFATKMDSDLWNKGFSLLGKLTQLFKEKKTFLLASAEANGMATEKKQQLEKNWDVLVRILTSVSSSEIKTLDGLKGADIGKLAATVGNPVAADILKLVKETNPEGAAELNVFQTTKFTLVKQDGDTAILKEQIGTEPEMEKVYKNIDGKWLPADMVDNWATSIADAKSGLGGMAIPPAQKEQFMAVTGMVDQAIDRLIAAKDQAAFDGEIQGIIGMAAMFAPMMGGGPPGMSGPPGGAQLPGQLPATAEPPKP